MTPTARRRPAAHEAAPTNTETAPTLPPSEVVVRVAWHPPDTRRRQWLAVVGPCGHCRGHHRHTSEVWPGPVGVIRRCPTTGARYRLPGVVL